MIYSYLCRTDPADVARVESKTWIATDDKYETVPHVRQGVRGILGQWKHTKELEEEVNDDFDGCMAGVLSHLYDNWHLHAQKFKEQLLRICLMLIIA